MTVPSLGDPSIEITVHRREAGVFDTYLGGRWLCTSATPFRDSAILLMAEGHAAGEVLVMVAENRLDSLQAPLGYAEEFITPLFVPWRPVCA